MTLISAFLLVKPVYHDLEYDNNVELLLSSNITTNNEELSESKIEASNPLMVEIAFMFIFTTILLNNNLNSSIINRASLLENKCLNAILIFGSIAGLMSSTVIVLVTSIVQLKSHFLLWPIVAFSFIIATSLTTIISYNENQSYTLNYNDESNCQANNKVEFEFNEKFLFGKKTLLNCKRDFEIGIGISNPSIVTAKVSTIYPFDTKYDEVYRNIRRCSLAPLGDSFLLKQYELDDRKVAVRHFKNVTKVVPLEKVSENGLPNLGYRASFDNGNKSLILEIPSFSSSTTANWIEKKDLSWLHLKLIKKSLQTDSRFIKLLMALILIGIVGSFNQYSFVWLYLMKSKVDNYDTTSFLNLSAYILICQQLSEILIYYYYYYYDVSTLKSLTLKYPTNFTFILSTYVIRYLLYLTFEIYKNEILVNNSLLIILVELLQGFQTSWLNLIIFELSIKFANKSEETLQKLANLGSIEKNESITRNIRFRLTMTTICLFYCCLNGIGGGIGLLTGGLLIDLYGFTKLWFICSIFASIAGLFQYFMFQNKSF